MTILEALEKSNNRRKQRRRSVQIRYLEARYFMARCACYWAGQSWGIQIDGSGTFQHYRGLINSPFDRPTEKPINSTRPKGWPISEHLRPTNYATAEIYRARDVAEWRAGRRKSPNVNLMSRATVNCFRSKLVLVRVQPRVCVPCLLTI